MPFRLAFPSCFCQKVYASAVSERLMKKLIHFTAKPLLEVIYYQVSLHVRKYFGESLIFAFALFFFQYAFLNKKPNWKNSIFYYSFKKTWIQDKRITNDKLYLDLNLDNCTTEWVKW